MAEFDIRSRDRNCSVTGKELVPGEVVYSSLIERESGIVRLDFSEAAWTGPPEESIGWWKARIPEKKSGRIYWAPNAVVLSYFHELREQPDQAAVVYLLALLMVRKRILRMEEFEDVVDEDSDGASGQVMVVTDPTDEAEYRIPTVDVAEEQIEQIQNQLCELLFSDEPPAIEEDDGSENEDDKQE